MGNKAVGGPSVASNEGNRPEAGMIPFRRATTPRTSISESTSFVISAATQNSEVQVDGTGYITGIHLEFVCTTAGNAAAVAFQPDGPYSVLDTISLRDSGGELINLTGYELYIANLYFGTTNFGALQQSSTDTGIYSLTTGAVATGGSFRIHLFVPIAVNTRNFLGLLGNQDRGTKYFIRTNIAASSSIYSVAPTNAGTLVLNRTYLNVTVPAPVNASRKTTQEIQPRKFGVQHFITRQTAESAPVGGSTIQHRVQRTGNTIRAIALIFKSNGTRALAEASAPTRIVLKMGDTPIFTESWQYRRLEMYRRYGFDAPAGVLVYDFLRDVLPISAGGAEFGLDYLWTAGLATMAFEITYPAGFGAASNSLVMVVDDLKVPDGIDLYAPDGM